MMYFKDWTAPTTRRVTVLKQRYLGTRSELLGALGAVACLALPLSTQAQSYPNKPITFYVS